MADLTPEQLERLEYLAALKSGLDNEPDETRDHTSSEMLGAVCLEFMEHATALVEAARKLEKIRAMLAVEDDGPEGSMGPRWLIGQIKEALNGR